VASPLSYVGVAALSPPGANERRGCPRPGHRCAPFRWVTQVAVDLRQWLAAVHQAALTDFRVDAGGLRSGTRSCGVAQVVGAGISGVYGAAGRARAAGR